MSVRISRCAIVVAGLAVAPTLCAERYEPQVLVPPSAMHAVEGIFLDDAGQLYGTSIHGQRVYRIDRVTGVVTIAVDSPHGESDDVAVGPAGTAAAGILAWTAQRSGEVRVLRPGGKPEVVLRDAPRVNPIAFNAAGRLFSAQVGAGDDTLWELDPSGVRAARRVMSGRGRLNGFAFGPDGRLYAPQFGTDRLVAIDVETGVPSTVANGLGAPAAVRVAPNGDLYSVDYLSGDVWRTEMPSGRSTKLTNLPAPLDSLAIAPDGRLYLSSAADSSLFVFDPVDGTLQTLVRGWFTLPLSLALIERNGQKLLAVADPFGYRFVDAQTGAVTRPPWMANQGASTTLAANKNLLAIGYGLGGRLRVIDREKNQILTESTAIQAPRGLVLLDDGSVIVADFTSGRLLALRAGELQAITDGLQQPVAVLRDGSQAFLVSEFRTGRIMRVDARSGAMTVAAQGLDRPTGLAWMPDGRLAVVEASARRIVAVSLRSKQRTVLASNLPLSLHGLDLPPDTPAGIAVDATGALYVSCPEDNSIRVLRPGVAKKKRRM